MTQSQIAQSQNERLETASSQTSKAETESELSLAVDVGGTFTDITLISADGRILTHKVPSTPPDYDNGIIAGIEAFCSDNGITAAAIGTVLHACTVATNAILEKKGARVVLITTEGFRDLLEFRRIRVPRLYDPQWRKPPPLVARELRLEIRERVGARGEIVLPLEEEAIDEVIGLLRDIEFDALAVCLINSYVNPAHEALIAGRLRSEFPDRFVTISSELLPEIREYERTSTTVVNSYVGPVMRRYVDSLVTRLRQSSIDGRLMIMQSSGGVLDADTVVKEPARVIECGPAAGVIAALELGKTLGLENIITLDMGGTTAKASLVENGRISTTDEYEIGGGISLSSQLVKGGGYALKTPVIDISEVGAGGGSIVRLDRAGQIKVGPDSAGSIPGPAAYCRGNEQPTVMDANVVLGYISPGAIANGTVKVNAEAARRAVSEYIAEPTGADLLETAYGIHLLANASMMRAVRSVSSNRGRDPADFVMVAFGGNGGIHGVPLARELGIRTVIVPAAAGVFSAVGLLVNDVAMTKSHAFLRRLDLLDPADFLHQVKELESRLLTELRYPASKVVFTPKAAMRYVGQAFELNVNIDPEALAAGDVTSLGEAFEAEHERTYGHRFPGRRQIQIVSISVTGTVRTDGRRALRRAQVRGQDMPLCQKNRAAYFGSKHGLLDTPVIRRSALGAEPRRGPLIIEDPDCTSVVPPEATVTLDPRGHLIIQIASQGV